MNREVKAFVKVLNKAQDKFADEYNNIFEHMQSYDISAFNSELDSCFEVYSKKYFDENKFKETALKVHNVDIDNPTIKEQLIDDIYYYSHTLIALSALKEYIRDNHITTETDNEGMAFNE